MVFEQIPRHLYLNALGVWLDDVEVRELEDTGWWEDLQQALYGALEMYPSEHEPDLYRQSINEAISLSEDGYICIDEANDEDGYDVEDLQYFLQQIRDKLEVAERSISYVVRPACYAAQPAAGPAAAEAQLALAAAAVRAKADPNQAAQALLNLQAAAARIRAGQVV